MTNKELEAYNKTGKSGRYEQLQIIWKLRFSNGWIA